MQVKREHVGHPLNILVINAETDVRFPTNNPSNS